MRLYVDGDLDSLRTMRFWWTLLDQRPDLSTYGYSKSWELFLAYNRTGEQWPTNYRLNLSSGSKYPESKRLSVAALPITRGSFTAIESDAKLPDRRSRPAAFAQALKDRAKAKDIERAFVCPGRCGDCLPSGEHACGSTRFVGVDIITAIH